VRKMGLWIIRSFFLILCVVGGFYSLPNAKMEGVLIGFFGSLIVIGIEILLSKIPPKKLILAVGGLIIGLLTAILIANFFLLIPFEDQKTENLVIFGYNYRNKRSGRTWIYSSNTGRYKRRGKIIDC
jgi:branched-subunit amino acid ABC-type transport system permease component